MLADFAICCKPARYRCWQRAISGMVERRVISRHHARPAIWIPTGTLGFTHYSNEIKLRFFAALSAMLTFVVFTEFARSKNQAELLKMSAQLDLSSRTDSLTGLANRRYVKEFLAIENSRCARTHRPFTIILGDIDNFKAINDTYGHATGDEVLKAVASCLRSERRNDDMVGRWGGEEFLIVLSGADATNAAILAEKIRLKVASIEVRHGKDSVKITMSFGIETVTSDVQLDDCIGRADAKLLTAKRSGKNQCIS